MDGVNVDVADDVKDNIVNDLTGRLPNTINNLSY